MDFEHILKVVPLAGVVIAGASAFLSNSQGWKKNLKEEYAFARDFFAELKNSDLHPMVRERGYQAIAGSSSVSASEVEFLLSLSPSGASLKDYLFGRHYLAHVGTGGIRQVEFKSKYQKRSARWLRKFFYFVIYMFCVIGAVHPLFLPRLAQLWAGNQLSALAILLMGLSPFAYFSLLQAMKISRAESLVDRQSAYTTLTKKRRTLAERLALTDA